MSIEKLSWETRNIPMSEQLLLLELAGGGTEWDREWIGRTSHNTKESVL